MTSDIVANGPIEIVVGQQMIQINAIGGPILRIHNARHVVIHYLDHAETEIFGTIGTNPSN